MVQPTHYETGKSARSDGLQHQHSRCSRGRVKPIRRSSGGAEAIAHALDKRDHPFELRSVLGVWAALSAHCGIRAKEVTHHFERRGHLSNERAGELQLTSLDRDLRIRIGQVKAAAEQGCRLPGAERAYDQRSGAVERSPFPDDLTEV